MKLKVNGEQKTTEAKTLGSLLQSYDIALDEQGVAIAVNDQVVSRGEWPEYYLEDGDRVEIIRATQGG